MTKIDVISGFLGAGKTALIKKLIAEAYAGEKLVLIENEFGEIGIDGGFLSEVGVNITEMNSGCICCSLVGDFSRALAKVVEQFSPDRILIEPSGVGKLSEVAQAVLDADIPGLSVGRLVTVADASKCRAYMKNFGEFYSDQIESASVIVLTRTEKLTADKLDECVHMLRSMNADAVIITTPIALLGADSILSAAENTLDAALASLRRELEEHHHDHHDDHDEHHHHDHDHEHEHEHHHHHDHDEDECDDPNCSCHHHHDHDHEHEHHHHHHADEVFNSIGIETVKQYDIASLKSTLDKMANGEYGMVVRSKGIILGTDDKWYVFNLEPEEVEIKEATSIPMGKIVVIGSHIDEDLIRKLF